MAEWEAFMEQWLKLPVGIDDFEKIRRNEKYHALIALKNGKYAMEEGLLISSIQLLMHGMMNNSDLRM